MAGASLNFVEPLVLYLSSVVFKPRQLNFSLVKQIQVNYVLLLISFLFRVSMAPLLVSAAVLLLHVVIVFTNRGLVTSSNS